MGTLNVLFQDRARADTYVMGALLLLMPEQT